MRSEMMRLVERELDHQRPRMTSVPT
jgi:hypothetical protein